jgi:predicted transcriptional regulator YdeE
MRDGGKGDTPRPLGVPMEQFDNSWDAIFGKKTPKEQYEAKKAAVLYDPRDEKKETDVE